MKNRQIQTVSIAPNQVFRINPYFFTGYFILGVLALVVGFICWILFRVQVGVSEDAHLVPIPKTLLYVSVGFLAIATIFITFASIQYIRIFRFRLSASITTVTLLQLLSLVMIGIVIADIRKSFLECVPPSYKFSPIYNRCIPVCPRGYFLDTEKFVCVPGCQNDNDCTSISEVCTNGKCCDLTSHTITSDGQCCPNDDVVQSSDGTTVCCPTGKLCGNECCLDPDATCDPTTNTCRIQCGPRWSCSASEVCVEDPATNFQQCVPKRGTPMKSSCQVVSSSNIPDLPGTDFFPATKNIQELSKDVLTCNPYDTTASSNCRNDILQKIRNKDPSVLGYSCGLSSPVQFKSTLMKGDCDLQDFVSVVDPVSTDKIHVIQVDDQHVVVNQRMNPLRNGTPDACMYNTYQRSCEGCISDQCPFQHDSKTMICQYVDGVGIIKDTTIRSKCDVLATAPDASNQTTWNVLPSTQDTSSTQLRYAELYHLKANDDSSKFNQTFLSARGSGQAPTMSSEPWKWRMLPQKYVDGIEHEIIRTGDIVAIQSYEAVSTSPQKYDRAYLSTDGTYHQPSMNFGQNVSSVEDGTPTSRELWMVLDDTYVLGKHLTTRDGIYLIKYVGSEDPKVPFANMAVSISGSAPIAPYMMGQVRSLTYRCSKQPKDPRNDCPTDGKCALPTFDPTTFQCHSVSGDTKPLYCRQLNQENVIQAMCCDTKNFQQFLNQTPNFYANLTCDTDGNDLQNPVYGDSRHRMFCTTPQQLGVQTDMDVQRLNEQNWTFTS